MTYQGDSFTAFSLYLPRQLYWQLEKYAKEIGQLAKTCQALYPVFCRTRNDSVVVSMNDQIVAFLKDKIDFGPKGIQGSTVVWKVAFANHAAAYQCIFWLQPVEKDPLWNYSIADDVSDIIIEDFREEDDNG
jgi:hypothetical protein